MTCRLRWENCCDEPGCKRPARYGVLCSACLFAASPARRAVELEAQDADESPALLVSAPGAAWLRDLFAA